MLRELGPVLGGLMVAGRVSSAIAAEIGTMKVTEQIDALSTLSTDPIKYLVFPRLLAATVSMPFLVLIGNIIGIMGGYFVGVNRLGFNSTSYILNTFEFLTVQDLTSGLIKAGTFGFIIASMGCFSGINSSKGAEGVGRRAGDEHAVGAGRGDRREVQPPNLLRIRHDVRAFHRGDDRGLDRVFH